MVRAPGSCWVRAPARSSLRVSRTRSSPRSCSARATAAPTVPHEGGWPLPLALTVLGVLGVLAALVSDWFVVALQPAMDSLGVSQFFAGLVVVAIAGNAIENVVPRAAPRRARG